MAGYRLYTINEVGRICGVAALEFETDDEACALAVIRLGRGPAIEVWQEARRVAMVTADGTQLAKESVPDWIETPQPPSMPSSW